MDSKRGDDRAFDTMQAMLEHMHRKQDNSALIETIRANFPTGRSMYRASRHLWERMGMRKNDALLFGLMKDVVRYSNRTSFGEHPQLGSLKAASPYLASNFFNLNVEHFYMYCINHQGRMKERILLSEGIADTALFDLRKLLMEAVRVYPLGGVIIAHNHPGGTLRPSQDDIDCTLQSISALTSLKFPLLDHIIVANGKVVSLRQNGFIPEKLWMSQNPKHRLLRAWLSDEQYANETKKKNTRNQGSK